jgi:hypothetical protein
VRPLERSLNGMEIACVRKIHASFC